MEGIELGNLVNLEERNDSQVLNATSSTSPKSSSNFSSHSAAAIALSLFLFFVAGLFEIGGGYLIWRGIRDKFMPALFLPLGSAILIAYGFVVTLQPLESFGRTFAIYGGFFILLSYIWGYLFDDLKVDLGDVIGTAVALAGVCIAWFWPR
jgi:drug/metabolite transporter superfamily protein YnfA